MEDEATQEETPKKRSKMPLIAGLVAMLALGGGGFYATYSGLVALPFGKPATAEAGGKADKSQIARIAFVPVEPMVISLSPGARATHLRFVAQLEVDKGHKQEVTELMPRVLDVLNGYLRAIAPADLENPATLVRLRAQMLRRVQVVTGPDRVRDLLVTEFVLN